MRFTNILGCTKKIKLILCLPKEAIVCCYYLNKPLLFQGTCPMKRSVALGSLKQNYKVKKIFLAEQNNAREGSEVFLLPNKRTNSISNNFVNHYNAVVAKEIF